MIIESIDQGRKEDGNLSIADKIIKRLHDLEMTVDVNFGRWVWELLQNAKDSVVELDRSVDIKLELMENSVVFSHNGKHFSERDIRGLINQISSKEIEEGEQKILTGRFGTGFITTHLLSKIVEVKSVVETADHKFYKFNFRLDRIGTTTQQLAPKIEAVWKDFFNSAEQVELNSNTTFITSFTYPLSLEKNKETAKKGIDEFINLIPFVMVFIPKIGKVDIVESDKLISFARKEVSIDDFIFPIIKIDGTETSEIHIAFYGNEKASVAIKINPLNNTIEELKGIPRLFCDFPLMGTENFYFPVIVNSFYFNPRFERDSVWLKASDNAEVKENRDILVQAIQLYKILLNKLANYGTKDLFYVADSRIPEVDLNYFDAEWYKKAIQVPLRDVVANSPIVDTVHYGRISFFAEDKSKIDFPIPQNPELREKIWKLTNKFITNFYLPEFESIHKWHKVLWDNQYGLTIESIVAYIARLQNIETLQKNLNGDVFLLLNELCQILLEEKQEDFLNKYAIVPNKLGQMFKLNEVTTNTRKPILYYDEINDEQLIEILRLLGNAWNTILIHPRVNLALTSAKLDKTNIANHITSALNKSSDKAAENIKTAIVLLSEWFEKNLDDGKTLFTDLYARRAELFMNTVEDKESLYNIMKGSTSLAKVYELSVALENDPEILKIIQKRQLEIQEIKDRTEIGESVEFILKEILTKYGFNVKKVIRGRDLVVTIEGNSFKYDIEVKSTRTGDYVGLTSFQATTAVTNSKFYSLCVVHKDSNYVTPEFVKERARFVTNIGDLLKSKVEQMQVLESEKDAILNQYEEIVLTSETELEYRFKVSSSIWNKGKTLDDFVTFLKQLSGVSSS